MCLVAVIVKGENSPSILVGSPDLLPGYPRLALETPEEDTSRTRIYVSIALLFFGLFAAITLETLVAWSILAYDLYPTFSSYVAHTDLPDLFHTIDSARTNIKRSLRYQLRETLLAMIETLERLRTVVGDEEAEGPLNKEMLWFAVEQLPILT